MDPRALDLPQFVACLKKRNPGQAEFVQAVEEVVRDLANAAGDMTELARWEILRRIAEPDRVISFRVVWQDDHGGIRVQRGWRVQHSNAIGPYKGGIRFHRSVSESVLKFLAFEQTLKCSLTGLPLGGAKGGANFNPKAKSDGEVMRFCQSFMTELYRHVGDDIDVGAGDIGVGEREIGYMFGQYKRITNRFNGVLTGKSRNHGGSAVRTEATGWGVILFLQQMLAVSGADIAGKTAAISGAGNVAIHAARKFVSLGGKVLTVSDSEGFIHDRDGLDVQKLDWIEANKNNGGRVSAFAREFSSATFHEAKAPWSVPCDVAIPCATQNEIAEEDAKSLIANGCSAVCEGANMPTQPRAIRLFKAANIPFAPGKAANAGGVAVSGFEMSQNAARIPWPEDAVYQQLVQIMSGIHDRCREFGEERGGRVDYAKGANVASFQNVAKAMLAHGAL